MTGKDRLIPCRDPTGRRRMVAVIADPAGIIVIAPPGETAVLSVLEVAQLRSALAAAAREHAGPGGPAIEDVGS